jgi:hypothetical protein
MAQAISQPLQATQFSMKVKIDLSICHPLASLYLAFFLKSCTVREPGHAVKKILWQLPEACDKDFTSDRSTA